MDEAARRQAALGDTLMGSPPVMVELAEYLVESILAAAWALFAKNGTDVVTLSGDDRPKRHWTSEDRGDRGWLPWSGRLDAGIWISWHQP